jgi:hypothetical protein
VILSAIVSIVVAGLNYFATEAAKESAAFSAEQTALSCDALSLEKAPIVVFACRYYGIANPDQQIILDDRAYHLNDVELAADLSS